MGLLRAAIRWNQTEAFGDSQDVRVNWEDLPTAREGERNGGGFDTNAFVLTQEF